MIRYCQAADASHYVIKSPASEISGSLKISNFEDYSFHTVDPPGEDDSIIESRFAADT